MIFVFLGCVAIVLKGLIILQDNKFIRIVTAYSVFGGNERYTAVTYKSFSTACTGKPVLLAVWVSTICCCSLDSWK